MKKYLFLAVLVISLYFPASNSQMPNEQIIISISTDGKAKVIHKIDTETLVSNILVESISNKISKTIATDENNILLKIRTAQNQSQIRIDTLGASEVKLSYDADIVTTNTRIWKLEYRSASETTVMLPAPAKIIAFNTIPVTIINDSYIMPQGDVSISFVIESIKTQAFTIKQNNTDHQIIFVTAANIENFSTKSETIKFSVDDNVPILAVIPKQLTTNQYTVFFNDEKIKAEQFNQNSTHYWLKLDTPASGTVTISSDEIPKIDYQTKIDSQTEAHSGCLIATATYGTELAPQVQLLREVRDNVLFSTNSGTMFMTGFNEFYYTFSPAVADLQRQNPIFKEMIKITITPMLSTMSILNYVDIDSEREILGYGVAVILLNVCMYFVIPTLTIIKIKQYFSRRV